MNIGFIGVGSMGKPMIRKMLASGYRVTVNDKYPESAQAVIAEGAIWRENPKECAIDADIVITCLPLPHHVLENMSGDLGALEGMKPGTVWIDTSTTDYHNTLRIAEMAKNRGILSLEAPTSNLSHMGIDFCNASFYVGGDKEGYDKSKKLLDTIGEISFFVGKIGDAQTIKLLTNVLYYTGQAVFGEAMLIAQKNSIPLYWMWDYIKNSTAYSIAVEQFGPFLFDGSFDTSCSLEIAHKDMSLTVDLAEELGVNLPLGRIVQERYHQTYDKYHPYWHVSVNKLLETENDTKLRIPGFSALSKYGRNKDYIRPEGLIIDKFGRKKPKDYENYKCPEDVMKEAENQSEWKEIGDILVDYVTWTNWICLGEAVQLGLKMGHSKELLHDVILWSVGTCWVSDNKKEYNLAQGKVLERIRAKNFHLKHKLPILSKLLSTFH